MATEVDQSAAAPTAPAPAQIPSPVTTPGSADPANATAPTSAPGVPAGSNNAKTSPTSKPNQSTTSSGSRRPPRKSTLTQQQKNQKRQRATQDQLATLELEFNKNPTPTAQVRDRIADEINMTERSVQIWFQNRRAKIKLMAKKGLETGEGIDQIPESMRNYLAMQAMETGKGFGGAFLGRHGMLPYGPGAGLLGDNSGKVYIQHFTCRSLSIGKWMRVGQTTMDLVIFYTIDKRTITYYINNDQAGYKIEYPFHYVKNIYLEHGDNDANKMGGIVIELNHPPHFFMDSMGGPGGFTEVGDFTEDQQASHCMVHHLGGNPKVLSGQLAKLAALDTFIHRHQPAPPMTPMTPFDQVHAPMPLSAPVSPTNRPSSQPNFSQPHVGVFQEQQWGIGVPPGMRGPGHKRQRSRSVPMAVDFSMLQTPMPSFYIQQPGEAAPQPHSPGVFSPVPQQPNGLSPINPNLRIDTQAGFGLDMRQYPMSAATTASPSEFSTPNYFSQGPDTAPLNAPSISTPYSGPFLSPMMNPQNMAPPVSPLPFTPADPTIVEQSPPMSLLGRPGSADAMSNNPNDSCAISDDGHSLNEMYSKHTINLPMHPPHSPAFIEPSQTELDMSSLVQFDTVDPASLSPENVPQAQSPLKFETSA